MLDFSKFEGELDNLKLDDLKQEKENIWAYYLKIKTIIQFKEEFREMNKGVLK